MTLRTEAPRLLLRPEEVADAIGLGRSKTYQLITSGQIRSVQVGRSRRVPLEAVREFVARLEAEADALR